MRIPHPYHTEGSTPTRVKVLQTNLHLFSERLLHKDRYVDTLIKCIATGNTYYTQKRFLIKA